MFPMPIAGLLALVLIPVSPSLAAPPVRFAGQLSGLVTSPGGAPQAGAVVMLFNKQDRLLQQVASDIGGTFSFADLLPDLYSIQVTLSSFVPAVRQRIPVRAGMQSLLEVNLSRAFSSVQLVSTVPAPGGLMNDDWKWTLRANSAMRPILRYLPALTSASDHFATFSDSRGMVRISASDGSQAAGDSGDADLGTQFAFATSVNGANHVQVSGNLAYAPSGAPAAGLRTTYSREFWGATPAVSVTMRQMYLPLHVAQGVMDGSAPALRTIAVSLDEKKDLTDELSAEYGFELDMVSFVDHLHYFSPYARLNYALPHGRIDLTWTSGNARPELGLTSSDQNADLQRDLAALAAAPRVSLYDGQAKVQRGDDYEVGYSEKFGSREYRIALYDDHVSNTTVTIANPQAGMFAGDVIPDLFSNSAIFNAGTFDSAGYTASVAQDLGDHYKVTASYGLIGVMEARSLADGVASADDLRRMLEAAHRGAFTLSTSGTARHTGTRFVASYQWTDYRSAMPGPQFSTQSGRPEPGLNVILRQPIPSIPGVPWHIEASAEMRNLLAQGYLPLMMANGQQLLLVNTPRSFRGGLAFVF
jgi:hypothetical protein